MAPTHTKIGRTSLQKNGYSITDGPEGGDSTTTAVVSAAYCSPKEEGKEVK
ncbi:hypothetical protein [Salmonella bongori]|uniref:hypothetical protein n=1 Tax=Salmonella bongori TaxID=54736 RepID=UPI0013B7F283|nr:hypothetical protein [Salmonella bongori]EDP8645111.1 hypothetical protein [Salmonella bongori]